MRLLLLVLLVSLAGCTGVDLAPEDGLLGLCPQWVEGPGGSPMTTQITQETNVHLDPPREADNNITAYRGLPLDMYRLRFDAVSVTSGSVRLTAFDPDGKVVLMRDYRQAEGPQIVAQVTFAPDARAEGVILDLLLTQITGPEEPQPRPITLQFTLDGEGPARATYSVTYHYRVCGA